ncbi:MAG: nucleotidyltransferase domain-containing protein [Thermoplasmata archaeon]|nr:nucleotidyltransferase domain-containing protein [Thermoplasmata archaeon]
MKIHCILDDVLGSKSKIRILRLLFKYPEREFTEREIAEIINMSPNTVNLALRECRKTNIFIYKRIGKTHSYKCNSDSVLFSLFEDLFRGEQKVNDNMINLLKSRLRNIGTSILFGSFARGEESFDSDLDLLIVTEDKDKAEAKLEELTEELLIRFSISLSPIILAPEELKAKSQKAFIKEALSEGKIIVGKGLEV